MSEGLTPTSVEARFNAAGLIGPATWLARVGVFVVVSVVALQERTDHHGVVVAAQSPSASCSPAGREST